MVKNFFLKSSQFCLIEVIVVIRIFCLYCLIFCVAVEALERVDPIMVVVLGGPWLVENVSVSV